MTYSDYKKVFKQLRVKPVILAKYKKHNSPKERSCGVSLRKCKTCGRPKAHIGKYGLDLCRQCFRAIATNLGFKKYG